MTAAERARAAARRILEEPAPAAIEPPRPAFLASIDDATDDKPTKTVYEVAKTVCLADVQPETLRWLWTGRIPAAATTLVDGDPGLGKSTMLVDIAARISTGAAMPFELGRREPASVIMMSAEDHLAMTIRPRLDAAGANARLIHAIVAMPRKNDVDAPPSLSPEDVARLQMAIELHGAKLVIVDPLMAYLGAEIDAHKDQDIRRVLRTLSTVAERTDCSIVIVRHLRKSGGPAIYRGGGSIGIVGAVRSALLAGKDPDDDSARCLASSKSNLGATPPTLRWKLVDCNGVGRVEWIGIADGITADDLAVVDEPTRGGDPEPIDAAIDALKSVLAHGPVLSDDVKTDVRVMADCSARTVDRARKQLGVQAEKVGAKWYMQLKNATPSCTGVGGVLEPGESGNSLQIQTEFAEIEERHEQERHEESVRVASLVPVTTATVAPKKTVKTVKTGAPKKTVKAKKTVPPVADEES